MRRFRQYLLTVVTLFLAGCCLPALSVAKVAVIRRDGSFVVEPKSGPIKALGDDWFVYSMRGSHSIWIVKPDGTKMLVGGPSGVEISCGPFEPGIAFVHRGNAPEIVFYCSRYGKRGLIDQHGKFIVEPKYSYMGEVAEGHFIACEELQNRNKGSRLVVLDENGVLTGSIDGYSVCGRSRFSGGIAPVQDEHRKIGFIDFTGRLVVPCQYQHFAQPRPNGYAVDFGRILIDKHGVCVVTKIPVPDANSNFPSGINDAYLVETSSSIKKKFGVVDRANKVVLPRLYDQIECVPGGFLAKGLGHFFLFDKHGIKILDFPDNVENVQIGSDQLIAVGIKEEAVKNATVKDSGHLKSLWGFIDRSGRYVIKPQFYGVSTFQYGVAMAQSIESIGERKCGLIDKTGKWVIKPTYSSVYPGKNLFVIDIPEPYFFSSTAWKENWDHQWDLVKLFRDKQVIGMSRDELQSLIGHPQNIDYDYCTYTIGSGIDTSLVIDFAFDRNSRVYRWRKRMIEVTAAKADRDQPTWTSADKYE